MYALFSATFAALVFLDFSHHEVVGDFQAEKNVRPEHKEPGYVLIGKRHLFLW